MTNRMLHKIWLDDVRPAPEGWTWYKCVYDVMDWLSSYYDKDLPFDVEISFDHDLGDGALTGYDLAKFIERCAHEDKVFDIVAWHIHSANPVGRQNIESAMRSFERERYRRS